MDVLLEDVLAASSLNTDDTPVDVRDAHGKQRYQGRFWTYVGDDLHPHTVLRYTPNHTRDGPGGPAEVLKNYSGFVQADAFSGYDAIYRRSQGRIVEVACSSSSQSSFPVMDAIAIRSAMSAFETGSRLRSESIVAKCCFSRFGSDWRRLVAANERIHIPVRCCLRQRVRFPS